MCSEHHLAAAAFGPIGDAAFRVPDLTIFGKDEDNAARFSNSCHDISGRTRTTASATWNNVPNRTAGTDSQSLDITTLEKVYAKKRRERAKSGEHIQLPKAGPDLEALKKSALAGKLGGALAPGAWVTLK